MTRKRAIRLLFNQRNNEVVICRLSDHRGAGTLLRYGEDRFGNNNARCPYCCRAALQAQGDER